MYERTSDEWAAILKLYLPLSLQTSTIAVSDSAVDDLNRYGIERYVLSYHTGYSQGTYYIKSTAASMNVPEFTIAGNTYSPQINASTSIKYGSASGMEFNGDISFNLGAGAPGLTLDQQGNPKIGITVDGVSHSLALEHDSKGGFSGSGSFDGKFVALNVGASTKQNADGTFSLLSSDVNVLFPVKAIIIDGVPVAKISGGFGRTTENHANDILIQNTSSTGIPLQLMGAENEARVLAVFNYLKNYYPALTIDIGDFTRDVRVRYELQGKAVWGVYRRVSQKNNW